MLFLYPLFFIFLKKNLYIDFSLILIRCMNNSSFVKINPNVVNYNCNKFKYIKGDS